MIMLITRQIKNLWTLARARYLGVTEGARLVPLRMEHVEATMYNEA